MEYIWAVDNIYAKRITILLLHIGLQVRQYTVVGTVPVLHCSRLDKLGIWDERGG
jgi:hypothetical protein